jgi:hypothetical protein
MSRSVTLLKNANAYDKDGSIKREIDNTLVLLKEFRAKYPFAENPQSIEWLDANQILKPNSNAIGEFFQYIIYSLEPLGHLTVQNSSVFGNIKQQLGDFKTLLRVAIDKNKSLAEKVDAPWERISGLGQDKQIAKKIIFCFNYESEKVIPIFNTPHLRHFVNRIAEASSSGTKYYSLGQEYAHYTMELLKAKDSLPITKGWEISYFTRFLYNTYPPPDREPAATKIGEKQMGNIETNEQIELRNFVRLLGELQTNRKITGEQFREYRELWVHQQPNDRDVTVWHLKQLLSAEAKPAQPKDQFDQAQKKPTRQRL